MDKVVTGDSGDSVRRPGQRFRQDMTDSGFDKEPEGGGREGKTWLNSAGCFEDRTNRMGC